MIEEKEIYINKLVIENNNLKRDLINDKKKLVEDLNKIND